MTEAMTFITPEVYSKIISDSIKNRTQNHKTFNIIDLQFFRPKFFCGTSGPKIDFFIIYTTICSSE